MSVSFLSAYVVAPARRAKPGDTLVVHLYGLGFEEREVVSVEQHGLWVAVLDKDGKAGAASPWSFPYLDSLPCYVRTPKQRDQALNAPAPWGGIR